MSVNLSDPGQQPVLVKTNIGGYYFDAFLRLAHTSTLTITQHPVETGAAVSDHAFVNPTQLVMDIGMSDAATSIIPGQFSDQSSRSVSAYQLLLQLQQQRIPLQVTTRLNQYDNMLIQSVVANDDNTTANALKATVTMQEIFVAVVQTVKISAQPQVTDSTNKGTVEPVQPNEAITKAMSGAISPAQ